MITNIDSIVIEDVRSSFSRTLDVTGFPQENIYAGHPVIKDNAGEYKPLPLNIDRNAYGAIPQGHSLVGVLIATIPTDKPFAAIVQAGTINPRAMEFPSPEITNLIKTNLPQIKLSL